MGRPCAEGRAVPFVEAARAPVLGNVERDHPRRRDCADPESWEAARVKDRKEWSLRGQRQSLLGTPLLVLALLAEAPIPVLAQTLLLWLFPRFCRCYFLQDATRPHSWRAGRKSCSRRPSEGKIITQRCLRW